MPDYAVIAVEVTPGTPTPVSGVALPGGATAIPSLLYVIDSNGAPVPLTELMLAGQDVPWVDVRATGATGDGVTNDTSAISAAIATLTSGGIVFFPQGTYITDKITIPAGVNILGAGIGVTILQPRLTNQILIGSASVDNVVLSGFSVKAHASGSTGPAIDCDGFRSSAFRDIGYLANGTGAYNSLFQLSAGITCYANTFEHVVISAQTPGPAYGLRCLTFNSRSQTAAGAITGSGNLTVTVTAAGMTNSPKAVSVAVTNGDSASTWAGKVRTALAADVDVNAFFTVSGSTTTITIKARTARTADATMNMAIAAGTAADASLPLATATDLSYLWQANINHLSDWMVYANSSMTTAIDANLSTVLTIDSCLVESNTGATGIVPGQYTTIRNCWLESNTVAISSPTGVNDVTIQGTYCIGDALSIASGVTNWQVHDSAFASITDAGVNTLIQKGSTLTTGALDTMLSLVNNGTGGGSWKLLLSRTGGIVPGGFGIYDVTTSRSPFLIDANPLDQAIEITASGVTLKGTIGLPAGSIAYSKLVLTTSIVNGDISASAAIAISKLASGGTFGAGTYTWSATSTLDLTTGINNEIRLGPTTDPRVLIVGTSQRNSSGHALIGRNLHGESGTDNYKTLYATSGGITGYAGIEFQYNGDTLFYSSNASASANGTVTPTAQLKILGAGGLVATAHIYPSADNTYDLGISTTNDWRDVFCQRGAFNGSSITLKRNIAPLDPTEALAAVLATEIVRYQYKPTDPDDTAAERLHIGFIAEQAPDMLSPDHQTVTPQTTAAVALAAVQALYARLLEVERNR